jgi:8-oxo-dGTP diphosphatase
MNTINAFHVGIYGIILKQSNILLIKKSRGSYQGYLDLLGGRPEFGEKPLQTLAREIFEETGIIAQSTEPFNNYSAVTTHEHEKRIIEFYHIGIIYRVTTYNNNLPIIAMNNQDSLEAPLCNPST